MHRFLVTLVFACCGLISLSAQLRTVEWTWRTPLPTGLHLHRVGVLNSGTIIVAGEDATLARTNHISSGTWTYLKPPGYIVDLSIDNGVTLWTVSNDGEVHASENEGDSFTEIPLPSQRIARCIATNNQSVAIGCDGAVVYRTHGSTEWITVQIPTLHHLAQIIVHANGSIYTLAADGSVYRFAMGSSDVQRYPPPFTGAFSVFTVLPSGTMVLGSENRGLFRWSSSDAFWSFAVTPVTGTVNAVHHTPNHVYAALETGEILRSADDGQSYTADTSVAPLNVNHIAATASITIAVGNNGCIVTATPSGGWAVVGPRSSSPVTAIAARNQNTIVAGCADGTILRWDGNDLHVQQQAANGPVHTITSAENGPIWMVTGNSQQMLWRSTDNGNTWLHHVADDTTFRHNFSVLTAVSDRCLVGVRQGSLYRTIDGAKSWQRIAVQENTTEYSLTDVVTFVSEDVWFVTTYETLDIFCTTDAGATWRRIPHAGMGRAHVIAARSAQDVMTGTSVSLNVSTNGGETWSRSPETVQAWDVANVSSNGLWCILTQQAMYTRSATDARWTAHTLPANRPPHSDASNKCMAFASANEVLVSVGNGGVAVAVFQQVSSAGDSRREGSGEILLWSANNRIAGSLTACDSHDGRWSRVAVIDAGGRTVTSAVVHRNQSVGILEQLPSLAPGVYALVEEESTLGLSTTHSRGLCRLHGFFVCY